MEFQNKHVQKLYSLSASGSFPWPMPLVFKAVSLVGKEKETVPVKWIGQAGTMFCFCFMLRDNGHGRFKRINFVLVK